MTLYKNQYRVKSTRLPNRDYAANGLYFVTICTHNCICYFGEISNSQMQLSPIGKIAQQFFAEIPQHSQYAQLDAYVIMPNHVHGIIVIDNPVETLHATSLHQMTIGGMIFIGQCRKCHQRRGL